jgi:hypothetical protein
LNRTARTVMAHAPHRPDWQCIECDGAWPCAPAKVLLSEEYQRDPAGLTIYMSGQMEEALAEAVRDRQWGGVDDLFDRFVGWVRGGGSAA